jgi:hypothetical protein
MTGLLGIIGKTMRSRCTSAGLGAASTTTASQAFTAARNCGELVSRLPGNSGKGGSPFCSCGWGSQGSGGGGDGAEFGDGVDLAVAGVHRFPYLAYCALVASALRGLTCSAASALVSPPMWGPRE